MEFRDKLVLIRARLHLSQEALARELNVSFSTINRWEKGRSVPQRRYEVAIDEFCKKNSIELN